MTTDNSRNFVAGHGGLVGAPQVRVLTAWASHAHLITRTRAESEVSEWAATTPLEAGVASRPPEFLPR